MEPPEAHHGQLPARVATSSLVRWTHLSEEYLYVGNGDARLRLPKAKLAWNFLVGPRGSAEYGVRKFGAEAQADETVMKHIKQADPAVK